MKILCLMTQLYPEVLQNKLNLKKILLIPI
jgi:hypothetical protein